MKPAATSGRLRAEVFRFALDLMRYAEVSRRQFCRNLDSAFEDAAAF